MYHNVPAPRDLNLITDAHVTMLRDMLQEVDTLRRNLMHELNQAADTVRATSNILDARHNLFVATHPELVTNYHLVQDALNSFLHSVPTGSLENQDAAIVFERLIAPLDLASSNLENMLENLDPSFVADPDTDEDMIQEAHERTQQERSNRNNNL